MKLLHAILFVGILIFIGGCTCVCDNAFGYAFIYCETGVAVLYEAGASVGTKLNPMDWTCPGSTPHPNSQAAQSSLVYSDDAVKGRGVPRKRLRHAATPASLPFLAQHLLQLPFTIFSSTPVSPACDSSWPDVFHVNHTGASVTRISTCPVQVKAVIPVATRPLQVAITPDGTTALVTSFDNAVNFIDLSTNKVTYTLQTDLSVNPSGIAITPDGASAYITSYNPTNPVVLQIDLASHATTATIGVTTYPHSVFLTPDGSQLYVTFPFFNAVYIIDTLSNTIANTLSIAAPYGLAFNSTGTLAYISSQAGNGGGTVQVLNTTTFQIVNSYVVGISPVDVTIPYGDRFVIVTNEGSSTISIIDTSNGTIQTLNTPGTNLEGISIIQ